MRKVWVVAVAIAVLCRVGVARAETIVAISRTFTGSITNPSWEHRLYVFDSATPGNSLNYVGVTGLFHPAEFEPIAAIDFNPANGQLYALTNQGSPIPEDPIVFRLYMINPQTGQATLVGSPFTLGPAAVRPSIDFDPVAGQLRFVLYNGLNYRINPVTGALAGTDTTAAWAAGDTNSGAISITGLAFTNSVSGATQTTAYAIDLSRRVLVRIGDVNGNPAGAGSGQLQTIGSLGITPLSDFSHGFDISAASGVAYAGIRMSNGTNLFTVNLTTGAATSLGVITGVGSAMTALAVSPVPFSPPSAVSIPAVGGWGLFALAGLILLTSLVTLAARRRLLG